MRSTTPLTASIHDPARSLVVDVLGCLGVEESAAEAIGLAGRLLDDGPEGAHPVVRRSQIVRVQGGEDLGSRRPEGRELRWGQQLFAEVLRLDGVRGTAPGRAVAPPPARRQAGGWGRGPARAPARCRPPVRAAPSRSWRARRGGPVRRGSGSRRGPGRSRATSPRGPAAGGSPRRRCSWSASPRAEERSRSPAEAVRRSRPPPGSWSRLAPPSRRPTPGRRRGRAAERRWDRVAHRGSARRSRHRPPTGPPGPPAPARTTARGASGPRTASRAGAPAETWRSPPCSRASPRPRGVRRHLRERTSRRSAHSRPPPVRVDRGQPGDTMRSRAVPDGACRSRSRMASTCATIPRRDPSIASNPRSTSFPSGPNAMGVASSVHQENQTRFTGSWTMWTTARGHRRLRSGHRSAARSAGDRHPSRPRSPPSPRCRS